MENNIILSQITLDALAEKIASKLTDLIGQPKKLPERINSEEAAKIIGCKESYLAQLRHKGEIPFNKNGRFISYNREEIEAFSLGKRIPTKSEKVDTARLAQVRKSIIHSN